ncbi:MAG: IS200/IS605 family transposase [Candidatus Neomarinimicrobiota bacterium]
MSHSLSRIWIHIIFGTKDRQPLIETEYSENIHRRIVENFEKRNSPVMIINGTADHVHVLFQLTPEKSLAELIKLVKAETANWINRQDLIESNFAWQTGYAAFSVSESQVDTVEEYIRQQIEHHRKRSYQEEVDLFLEKYGLK